MFAIHRLAVTGEEPIAALGKTNGTVELWNLATRTLLGSWQAHSNATEAVAFSPDGKRLATADRGGSVTVWDLATRQPVVQFGPLDGAINCVTFSPDGTMLAASGSSDVVWLGDIASGRELVQIPGHGSSDDRVVTIAFSPDGKLIATCTVKRALVLLWEVPSGKARKALLGHVQGVVAVAFSPDGKTLASAGHDRKVKLWHVATHQELATFSVGGMVRGLRFSPDGRTLAVGYFDERLDRDQQIRIWHAPSWADIEAAENRQKIVESLTR
jgi:WD40 repeat protein